MAAGCAGGQWIVVLRHCRALLKCNPNATLDRPAPWSQSTNDLASYLAGVGGGLAEGRTEELEALRFRLALARRRACRAATCGKAISALRSQHPGQFGSAAPSG